MHSRTAYIALCMFVLLGCENPSELQPITIGASLPLSGEAGSFGQGAAAGIDLAVQEINDAGGIDGRPLRVIYGDDKCGKEAAKIMMKFTTQDKVDAIVGPVCSAAAAPSLPIVAEQHTPTVIIAAAPDLTAIGESIFRVGPSDASAGTFMGTYLVTELDVQRAAVVYAMNVWGTGISTAFRTAFEAQGGEVVFSEGIAVDHRDMRTLVARLKEQEPAVVVTLLQPAAALLFLKQLKEHDVDARVMGGSFFQMPDVLSSEEADDALFVFSHVEESPAFDDRIRALGKTPSTLSTAGYDAVQVLARAFATAGTEKDAVRVALADVEYEGYSSPLISFDTQGDLAHPSFDVKQITDGVAVVIN